MRRLCVPAMTLLVLAVFASLVTALTPASPATDRVKQEAQCLVTPWGSAAIKPGVPLEEAMREMEILLSQVEGGAPRFQPFAGRWGPENEAGNPVVLTYSFPSDGLMVDGNINSSGDIQPNVLHARLDELFDNEETWKQHFRDMFDSWSAITGNIYTEVDDDDAPWGTSGPFHGNPGRGDVRIAMVEVTPTTFFAFNFFPENGDMVIDSEWPWGRFGGSFPEWRNMLAHEHGHGQGLFHTCPQDGTKLMEPTINVGFLGPQLDDALSAQFLYGDRFEPNQSGPGAVDLPALGLKDDGFPVSVNGLSLHAQDDFDLFRVPSTGATEITFQVSPTGTTYAEGPQTSACDMGAPFDTLRQADLIVDLLRPNFASATSVDASGVGGSESLTAFLMDEAGDWFLRVRAAPGAEGLQAYFLGLSIRSNRLPGDLTGDGCVDSVDLAILIAQWGAPGGDLTGDGTTDAFDLAALLAAWTGPNC